MRGLYVGGILGFVHVDWEEYLHRPDRRLVMVWGRWRGRGMLKLHDSGENSGRC